MTEESKKKNVAEITFTETEALGRYVTETGKILPRKFTGLTSKEQRHVKTVSYTHLTLPTILLV